jgi:hypothetical protein
VQVNCVDTQTVTSTDSVLFSLINQGAISAICLMTNLGTSTLNYHWQQYILVGGVWTWTDISPTQDNYFTGTLTAGSSFIVQINNTNPQIQLMGNSSVNTTLLFSVDRIFKRPFGGLLPLVNI